MFFLQINNQIGVQSTCDPAYGFLTIGTIMETTINSSDQMCTTPNTSLSVDNTSPIFVHFAGKTLKEGDGFKLNYKSGKMARVLYS